jgi:uncharacterized YccA/Bax inhibitor family protein
MFRRRLFRSSNPVFAGIQQVGVSATPATYAGIVKKTAYLFLVLVVSTGFVVFNAGFFFNNSWLLIGAAIGGFIVIITSRTPERIRVGAPIYAGLQGVVIGMIGLLYSNIVPGIVEAAIVLTLSIFLVMLVLYATGIVRVGGLLQRVVYSALGGLVLFSVVLMIGNLLGFGFARAFFGNLEFLLLFSLVGAAVASLMILIDLDQASMMVRSGADESMEWFAALGLMVTIIWLFLEILRILYIFAARNRR